MFSTRNPNEYNVKEGDFPNVVPAYIEVSKGSRNKYEYDPKSNFLFLDRVLHSAVFYPYNYGFIPQTLCDDGDALDVLIMGSEALVPGSMAHIRPISYLIMEDEKGQDEKVLAVLDKDPHYYHVKSMEDISKHVFDEITHFFESYKKLEKDKWVKVDKWKNTEETHHLIKQMHKKYNDESTNNNISNLLNTNSVDSTLIWTNPWSL